MINLSNSGEWKATPSQDAWNKVFVLCLFASIAKNHGKHDELAVQKLTFLSEMSGRKRSLKAAYYPFFRHNLGPYSKYLDRDVKTLEGLGLIEPISGNISNRGKFLLNYVAAEVKKSDPAKRSLQIAREMSKSYAPYRSSEIVNMVYKFKVPVDGRGGEVMEVEKIPLHTDIILPQKMTGVDVLPFSAEMVEDIHQELGIPASALDPTSEKFSYGVTEAYRRALAK